VSGRHFFGLTMFASSRFFSTSNIWEAAPDFGRSITAKRCLSRKILIASQLSTWRLVQGGLLTNHLRAEDQGPARITLKLALTMGQRDPAARPFANRRLQPLGRVSALARDVQCKTACWSLELLCAARLIPPESAFGCRFTFLAGTGGGAASCAIQAHGAKVG
jgi:hypothetical protein